MFEVSTGIQGVLSVLGVCNFENKKTRVSVVDYELANNVKF